MRGEVNSFEKAVKLPVYAVLVILVLALTSVGAFAQEPIRAEEVVVTASKMAEPQAETTSEVVVIQAEEIEQMGADFLPEVLNRVTEIHVIQNGGPGKSASVQLRGGGAERVVIMIDGVKVKSTTLGYYDLSGISADDIARIEIVKGPQSTMYGSEAMTGVINIITKKGGKGFHAGASYEIGSFDTKEATANVSGGDDMWNFRVSASQYKTDGISTFEEGDEEDAYENKSYSAHLGFVLADNVAVEFGRKYYEDENDLDYGSEDDDRNYTSESDHTVDSAKATVFVGESWEQVLHYSMTRDFNETEDPDNTTLNSKITAEMETWEWRHNFYVSPNWTLTIGYENRVESGENEDLFDEKITNEAAYLNIKQKIDASTWTLGGRYDKHESFGEEYTYRIGLIQQVSPIIRVRASYGTGFRAPTLNQLALPANPWSAGNPDLDPEKSKSWEVGVEQDLSESSTFSITYFEQKYEDLIQWVETSPFFWQPENVSSAKIKGVETTLDIQAEFVRLKASHTHLETEDDDGKRLRRRPKDKYFFLLGYFGPSFSLSGDYTYVGMSYDDPGEHDTIDAYQLVNLNASVKLSDLVKLYTRAQNVLDEDYETAKGFNTPGDAYYVGIKATF